MSELLHDRASFTSPKIISNIEFPNLECYLIGKGSSSVEQIQFKNLKIEIESNSDSSTLFFIGNINESFDFSKMILPDSKKINLDLAKVEQCNSYGSRQWIFFLRDLTQKSTEVNLLNCSLTMMDQFNIAPQMTHKANLESCYAPYFCPTCNEEILCLIDRTLHRKALEKGETPSIRHSCQTILEFDALTPDYFKLLK